MSEQDLRNELIGIREILTGKTGDNGMKSMLNVLIKSVESLSKELDEHKKNHKWIVTSTIAGSAVVVAILAIFFR